MDNVAQKSAKFNAAKIREGESPSSDAESGADIMQSVLSKPSKRVSGELARTRQIEGVVIGTLADEGNDGQPMVRYPGIPGGEAIAAISTEKITEKDLGRDVALSFIEGDPALPVILGLVQTVESEEKAKTDNDVDVHLDGRKLTLTADKEIVLKCGEASITLTRAGKIVVKGAYLSNHSTGVNRIKGGSVQIN